ncbi:MAG: YolD-like family protein [Duncaniella sp.]|nr:YolD-like family protein [Duncaniella sp.]
MSKYDDIIDLPHHVSLTHPAMSMAGRAAQFAPFSALTGYGEAINETSRLTQDKIELTDAEREELSARLVQARENRQRIKITYFVPDPTKKGGRYVTTEGVIKKIDEWDGVITLTDGNTIQLTDTHRVWYDVF